ncbi:hypothetical protein GGF32_005936 [Allomyces javanicus]|nr:hypothetical protein GGF32_005936 [Allomyces javanicus]
MQSLVNAAAAFDAHCENKGINEVQREVITADQSFADQGVRFTIDARMDPITFEICDKDPKRRSAAMGKGTVSRQELTAALNGNFTKWVQLSKKNGGGYAGELCIQVTRA